MKLVKKLLLWFAVILLTAIALGTISSLACIPALAAALLIAPIAPLQKFIRKFIKGKVKGIIVALLVILIIVASPKNNTTLESDSPEGTSTESVSISEDTDIETISDVITEPEAVATTEAVTEIETVATTEAATEVETVATTEAATEVETVATTEAVTEVETVATTEDVTEAVTEAPHVHIFKEATCTTPKACTCGITEGTANGHSWAAATCTAPQKCRTCSAENGYATGHSFSDGTCIVCGSKDPNYNEITYILNIKSKKFHRLTCRSLPTDNRKDTTLSRDAIVAEGYTPCGNCKP